MAKISYVKSGNNIMHIHAEGKNYTVGTDHINYNKIKEAIKEDNVEKLIEYCDLPKQIASLSNSSVEIKDGIVYFKGEPLKNEGIANRILNLMQEDLPFDNMIKFLENVLNNPSRRAVYELLGFLENRAMPITDDGCFFAYKRVRDDWKDFHSGKFENKIGTEISMARNEVDDDPTHDCSYGFHVGSIEYVKGFYAGQGKVLIVKVNPKDVVSVPKDGNSQKCRVCSYKVVSEYTEDLEKSSVYNSVSVTPITNNWRKEDNKQDYCDSCGAGNQYRDENGYCTECQCKCGAFLNEDDICIYCEKYEDTESTVTCSVCSEDLDEDGQCPDCDYDYCDCGQLINEDGYCESCDKDLIVETTTSHSKCEYCNNDLEINEYRICDICLNSYDKKKILEIENSDN